MSNSALANYINRSNSNYSERTELISKIMLHCPHATGDIYTAAEYINSSSSGFHYAIDYNGVIGLFCDEDYATLSSSSLNVDNISINILLMNNIDGSGEITSATKSALLNLLEDVCRRNFIQELTYSPNDRDSSSLILHSWYGGGNCPGSYIEGLCSSLASDISYRLKTQLLAESETESLKSQSTIAIKSTKPYIATIEYNAKNVDYYKLKLMGCVGAMFWAGCYYDSNHNPQPKYINPNLKQQVADIGTTLPYALYADVRAKTVDEAKKECYQLWFVVSKYPPKLGLWLHLDLQGVSQTRATEIITKYYEKITDWGLKDKCGFYATSSQLRLIQYKTWVDKFATWWISDYGDIGRLENLLTPSLFKI